MRNAATANPCRVGPPNNCSQSRFGEPDHAPVHRESHHRHRDHDHAVELRGDRLVRVLAEHRRPKRRANAPASPRDAPPTAASTLQIGSMCTLRWRLPGALRSRSSPLLRCDAAGGRPEAAVRSSRPGHARRLNRSASKSAPLRCWLMLALDALDDESRARLPPSGSVHPQPPSRSSSSFVAKSMPSWSSAATSGITRRGFFSSRKRAAVSPIEPEDMREIKAVACTPTPTCTVSCSPRFNTRRAPDRRYRAARRCIAIRPCRVKSPLSRR